MVSSFWRWRFASCVLPVIFWLLPLATCLNRATAVSLDEQLNFPLNNGTQGSARNEADVLLRLGGQQEEKGNLEKAIDYWVQALEIYRQIGDLEATGRTYDFLGITYGNLARYDQAEDALRRRLAMARDRQDFQGQIYGLNNVGTVLLQRGSLSAAQKTFEEALSIAQSVKNLEGEGLSLSNLGLVSAGLGDNYQAIKRYEAALTLRRRFGDPLGEANTLNNLGNAYLAVANYSESLAAYRAALRLGKQTFDRQTQLRAIDGLVAAYSVVGRYDNIFELLDQRLILSQQAENLRQELQSLRLYAQTYQLTGNKSAALTFYERSIRLARILGDEQTEVLLLNQLSQLLVIERQGK